MGNPIYGTSVFISLSSHHMQRAGEASSAVSLAGDERKKRFRSLQCQVFSLSREFSTFKKNKKPCPPQFPTSQRPPRRAQSTRREGRSTVRRQKQDESSRCPHCASRRGRPRLPKQRRRRQQRRRRWRQQQQQQPAAQASFLKEAECPRSEWILAATCSIRGSWPSPR